MLIQENISLIPDETYIVIPFGMLAGFFLFVHANVLKRYKPLFSCILFSSRVGICPLLNNDSMHANIPRIESGTMFERNYRGHLLHWL
jgi:hypothetical protein